MSTLNALHRVIAWAMIVSNAMVGAWFTAAQYQAGLRLRRMWWFVIPPQILVIVQAIIGALIAARGVELDDMHALYGFSAIVAVGILYSYRTSPFIRDRQYLLYGIGSLFIMGLGIRNLFLGHT
ncbi:MAG: hypothetical protein O2925_01360 [Actinomycetota bacterium]|nr:hypothetical protein [Actinomycetota bacterium]MDA3015142.1 hypothetical protein [Actinomycetota bacterium]MDA3027420.1 hypothetical protein [Actinomycetota bacterium]